ncbi:response regulator [Paenibacillus mucilaginosus]|uniref:Transcriptional regulatory protein n=1 Tax=Paenibacillus mucilaginosus (strain KNP414) TaxID=1036673 RepID=F8FGE2_PAEMK|nr:response regulator [Paenibacillus mucilaginosus]AEI44602.1 two-component response regulator [Paenibacillus mucilaginosus KNP414]MCG7215541.1 response regulator [Paenibacillus mucilaginosus]WDM26172.1 response regulator [Paenibacillus mucilaginosus]
MNEQPSHEITVLIVDDDPKIAEINRRFVEKVPGFSVIGIATDESQAREQLEILGPQLVLLDIYIPNSNGIDILQQIRRHHRDTEVIMITAAKEIEPVREAVRSGAFDYIIKPLVFNRLQETLLRFRDFQQQLQRLGSGSGQVAQDDIDRLLARTDKKEGPSSAPLPKGIDKLTLDKVVGALSSTPEGMTADGVAKLIGVSRSTGRRYLEHLVSLGDVYADLSYGVVGRPERVYRSRR